MLLHRFLLHSGRLAPLAMLALLAGSACQRPAASVSSAASACIDSAKVNPSAICATLYDPVCGCDGKTYSNSCRAENAGVRTFTQGPCPGK